MKEPADNLKSLFNDAFAREEFGFDMADWEAMSRLLMKRERRRIFTIWLSSGIIFMALSTALMFLFPGTEYTPRISVYKGTPSSPGVTATAVHRPEDVRHTSASTQEPTGTDQSTGHPHSSGHSNAPDSDAQGASPLIDSRGATTARPVAAQHPGKPVQIPSLAGTPYVMATDQHPDSQTPDTGNEEITHTSTPTPAPNLPESPATRGLLTEAPVIAPEMMIPLMPILPIEPEGPNADFREQRALEPPVKKSYLNWYASAGLNKTLHNANLRLYPGTGQRIAFGASYLVREHFLLSGELSLAREAFMDTVHHSGAQRYGLTSFRDHYVVSTTELLYLEMPVVASYRSKRIYLGGGAALAYLMALKNEVQQSLESRQTTVPSERYEQYYRWDRFRSLHLALLADAQYQLSPMAFIGLRSTWGLTDIVAPDDRTIRKTRLDVYLKLNIK